MIQIIDLMLFSFSFFFVLFADCVSFSLQAIMSQESLSLQFLDVVTILLKYCGPKSNENTETQAVIVDLVATLGFFCANNKQNQVSDTFIHSIPIADWFGHSKWLWLCRVAIGNFGISFFFDLVFIERIQQFLWETIEINWYECFWRYNSKMGSEWNVPTKWDGNYAYTS